MIAILNSVPEFYRQCKYLIKQFLAPHLLHNFQYTNVLLLLFPVPAEATGMRVCDGYENNTICRTKKRLEDKKASDKNGCEQKTSNLSNVKNK